MSEPTIVCPNCKKKIKLTESLAAPLIEATRKEYGDKLVQQAEEMARRESSLQKERIQVDKMKDSLQQEVEAKLKSERQKIAMEATKKARLLVSTELERKDKEVADLQDVLKQRDAKLAEAQTAQAEIIRKGRELDDAKREVELTIEQRVQESLGDLRKKAKLDAEEGFKLELTEKGEQIASMKRQIEQLSRKAEQGSQQLQGEAQEIELESLLRSKFPTDVVEPVPKGEFGGDVIQRVIGPQGQTCGTILWESKRTKNWSDAWLPKLRDDQRAAKADIALIVSHSLPKEIDSFDLMEGIWVTHLRCAIPVAMALRQSLIELSAARQASNGQQTKMEMVYQYLTSSRFRHRIEAIIERFSDMHEDLDRERKAMTRSWAKREEQIRGVIESTAGLYGDLQGIAGSHLQEIAGLEMPLLEAEVPGSAGEPK